MRIALANWTSRRVGGAEAYLDTVIPELYKRGNDLAFLWEGDVPANCAPIALPARSLQWTASEINRERTIDAVRDWHPDLIYIHRLDNAALETAILRVAPAVLFAHDYSRTCVSGGKTFTFPIVTHCQRRFGWKCLLHYYPHRCGGLSPITMWQLYRSRFERFPNLNLYGAIVTSSEHMRAEYLNHGLERVSKIPYPVPQSERSGSADKAKHVQCRDRRLLFVGRMVSQKGGLTLLEALPQVVKATGLRLRMTFVGCGPEQRAWQAKAITIEAREKDLRIEFTGWLEKAKVSALLEDFDLLVVPSLWPEPFGLVGIESGSRGVPAAAFDSGGIREWLTNGINGYLAPSAPPAATGLAKAIVKCLRDPIEYERLSRGAIEMASRFTPAAHVAKLLSVFEGVLTSGPNRAVDTAFA